MIRSKICTRCGFESYIGDDIQKAYEQGRADAIDEFANELKDYVVTKRMQGIEPYWAVAVYEVSEQLKEQK